MFLKTLINGGTRFLSRPLFSSRVFRGQDVPHEEPHGAVTAAEDPQPPDHVTPNHTRGDARRVSRRDSATHASFIKPDVSIERLQAADSVVSIVFGMKRLAWAHVDRSLTVTSWHQHEWLHLMKGRQHPDLYLEDVSVNDVVPPAVSVLGLIAAPASSPQVSSAVSRFPSADLYILERSSLSAQNAAMFPVTLHLRIVEAMLYALLNPTYSMEREHRVFSLGRTTVGKHFDIMVGGSKTSGVDLVQRLVEEAGVLAQPRIHFTPELVSQYKNKLHPRGQNRNEEMCDALLQALAFYELLYK
ncbi:transcription elongation factor, mitochondrial isoform X1 [Hyla sarda]|uniref:transcription elongation factor, mitochondrial isoform X1 n=1 Tax=Hyla sarda TaxID=327740 RepID=UPI0024C20DA0|nr:transcription elongation factor, mitochondrial isoform X1 [Hyla sarda]